MQLQKPLQIRDGPPGPAECTPIRLSQLLSASSRQAFEAWLDPVLAGRWLFATAWRPMKQVHIAAREGGAFHFVDDCGFSRSGRYLEIVPQQRLVFSLQEVQGSSQVSVAFAPHRRGCRLSLTHTGVPSDHAGYAQARWEGMLYGLELLLDSHSTRSHS